MALRWLPIPARVDKPELLDQGVGTDDDVRASLADLWRIHRWGGGLDAITHYLYPRLLAQAQPITLLDLGTGSAQIPAAIAGWCMTHQHPARILAVDFSARNLEIAQSVGMRFCAFAEKSITLLQADATRLPIAPNSVDYVISSLLLHHFPPEAVIDLLRSAWTCARRGIIMSDPIRNRISVLACHIGQPIFARSYLTQHDGLASIHRAYTPSEMLDLAHEAGLNAPKIHRRTPWQMTLVADRTQ